MGAIDLAVLAERAAAVERHRARVAARLPATPVIVAIVSDGFFEQAGASCSGGQHRRWR